MDAIQHQHSLDWVWYCATVVRPYNPTLVYGILMLNYAWNEDGRWSDA